MKATKEGKLISDVAIEDVENQYQMAKNVSLEPKKTPKLYEAGELDSSFVPSLDLPRRTFNAIVEIVHAKEALPNDQELGGYVRQIINAYKFTS